MSAQISPQPPDARPADPPKAGTFVLPLVGAVLLGAVCAWAVLRPSTEHRLSLIGFGALAAILLAATIALAGSRSRLRQQAARQLDADRIEAGRALGVQAEAARRAAVDAEGARRAAWEAEAALQAAVESEARLRAALEAESARTAALEAELRLHEEETLRLGADLVPQAVKQLRDGASTETVLAHGPQLPDGAHRQILQTVVREVGTSERMRASSMAACANAAGRVQALATGMLADLREMENRHGEEVLADLLKLDHGTAQAGRLADSIAVLTGARSGRRWTKPIVMESVLRGAMGRISAYQRVRLHNASSVAVAGYAAEGVMHALAELMDNATTFSPPTEEVHVYVQEMHSGVVVTIEDAGLVMPGATLTRAEKLVSPEPLDLTTLSGTRLGLAVVGCLARKHGLTVSFRPSSRGGTGVVVLIPPQLITRPRDEYPTTEPAPAPAPAPAVPPTRTEAAPATVPPLSDDTDGRGSAFGGLPKRPRGETLAAAASRAAAAAPLPADVASRPRTDAGARFGLFREASRRAAASSATSPSSSPSTPDTPSAENGQDTPR